MTVALSTGHEQSHVSAGYDSAAGRIEGRPRDSVSYSIEPKTAEPPCSSSPGRKISTCLPRSVRDVDAGDQLRHVRGHRRAAAAIAEVDPWLRRQLRLGDHHPHGHHQHRHLPAPPQERGVDAEDAGDPAGGESDPGSLREAEGDRSGETEDEPGDDGALQRARRQSRQRLRADAADLSAPSSRSTRCCRRRSSCAARRSSAGFTICRRTTRSTSRRS